MTINNPESYRTLTFEGVGTQFEIKRFTYLNRFRKGELLERDEWEYEYDEDEDIEERNELSSADDAGVVKGNYKIIIKQKNDHYYD